MTKRVEGKDLNVQALVESDPQIEELQIYTIRKSEFKNLQGLEKLPLKSLELRWFSGSDLTDFPLPPTLTSLKIWHSSKIKSLDGLETSELLQSFIFDDNCNWENTASLGFLKNLKELQLTGGRGTIHKISSIDSIADLPIEKLTMFAIDGRDLDITPILKLKKLRELDLAGPCFEPAELAKIAATYPWFFDQLLDLPDSSFSGNGCKKCKGAQKEMFLRGKKSHWCPKCNQAGIDKVIQGFRELVEQAKV